MKLEERMWKLLLLVNTLAIFFLLGVSFMNYESVGELWEMFQEYEKLLMEILSGRYTTPPIEGTMV